MRHWPRYKDLPDAHDKQSVVLHVAQLDVMTLQARHVNEVTLPNVPDGHVLAHVDPDRKLLAAHDWQDVAVPVHVVHNASQLVQTWLRAYCPAGHAPQPVPPFNRAKPD